MTGRQPTQLRADEGHRLPRRPAAEKKPLRKGRDRIQRFLGMIRLLAGGQEWLAKQLSEEFEVTERTVLRDMKVLEDAGLVIRPGPRRRGGYRLATPMVWERPELSLTEFVTLLAMAGRESDSGSQSQRATALATVAKLIPHQPADTRRRLENLARLLQSQGAEARVWLCSQEWLPLLVEALVGHLPLRVWVREESGEAGAEPLVLVPKEIETAPGRWLLRAYEVGGTELPAMDLEGLVRLQFDADRD